MRGLLYMNSNLQRAWPCIVRPYLLLGYTLISLTVVANASRILGQDSSWYFGDWAKGFLRMDRASPRLALALR